MLNIYYEPKKQKKLKIRIKIEENCENLQIELLKSALILNCRQNLTTRQYLHKHRGLLCRSNV